MVLTGWKPYRTLISMFERFTARARRTIVLAEEEARGLHHNYIGTEHVLLGLLGEPEGLAGQVLQRHGVTLDSARAEVLAQVGRGQKEMKGHIPFTPRAKKVLELALREALSLSHNYIGTEHLLLGLARESEGVGAQIVLAHVSGIDELRGELMALLSTMVPSSGKRRRWTRPGAGSFPPEATTELHTTPAADSSLDGASKLAGSSPVGSHHLMPAALTDPDSAAARALASMGVDLDQAVEALKDVDIVGTTDELPEQAGRRLTMIEVVGDEVVLRTADSVMLELAQRATEAVGAEQIRGAQPEAASLAAVWQSLKDSLEDIERRAKGAGSGPDGEATRLEDARTRLRARVEAMRIERSGDQSDA